MKRRKGERREGRGRELGRGGEEGKDEGGRGKGWKVVFWNVAGLKNKDADFWEAIGEWDVIFLLETWVDKKGWERIKGRMPGGFRWEVQYARRKSKKGRAMGGIIMGARKGVGIEGKCRADKEGMMEVMIEREGERWRLVGVYINGEMEEKLEEKKEWMEEEGRIRTIIGGDFNARTGDLGGRVEMGGEEGGVGKGRKSKDTRVNGEGRRMVKRLEEVGWAIMNGGVAGDEEGGWTYMGPNGKSVIDYVIGNEEVGEEIKKLEIGERMDSDHMPVIVWIGGKGGGGERKGKKRKRRWSWTDEGKKEFRERLGEIWERQGSEQEEGGIEGEWEKKKKKIQEVLDKGKEGERKEKGEKKRGWFDRECREEKGEVVKELKRWKRNGGRGRI